jgi:hypothetical protein
MMTFQPQLLKDLDRSLKTQLCKLEQENAIGASVSLSDPGPKHKGIAMGKLLCIIITNDLRNNKPKYKNRVLKTVTFAS